MTIWALALVLLALLAGVGYRQGAIRMGFSLVGILVAMVLAVPLGHAALSGLLSAVGIRNPVLIWALGPLVMFLAVSLVFKAIGFTVHRKVEYHYRYRTTDLRQSLWERLNRRLGLSLGLFNGLFYLLLISWAIYAFSFWTQRLAQASGTEGDPKSMQILNTLGSDLERSGFTNAALAMDHMPKWYYRLGDLVGTLYRNPQVRQVRQALEHYPGFMNLIELSEFRAIWTNKEFSELWTGHKPIKEFVAQPQINAWLDNPDQLKLVRDTLIRDMDDLPVFLSTGKSPKYDPETILGYWVVDANATVTRLVRSGALVSYTRMLTLKGQVPLAFHDTRLIAMPDNNKVLLKEFPSWKRGAGAGRSTLNGDWKKDAEGNYQLSLSGADGKLSGTFDPAAGQLVLTGDEFDIVFVKEH